MNTLYLTVEEQKLFDALSSDMREGWQTQMEEGRYEDSADKQMIRLSLVRLHDPRLLKLRAQAEQAGSIEEVASLIQDMNLEDVDEDDLAELFFALGPAVLSRLILDLLTAANSDGDVEGVTALTVIRHSILTSFHPVS